MCQINKFQNIYKYNNTCTVYKLHAYYWGGPLLCGTQSQCTIYSTSFHEGRQLTNINNIHNEATERSPSTTRQAHTSVSLHNCSPSAQKLSLQLRRSRRVLLCCPTSQQVTYAWPLPPREELSGLIWPGSGEWRDGRPHLVCAWANSCRGFQWCRFLLCVELFSAFRPARGNVRFTELHDNWICNRAAVGWGRTRNNQLLSGNVRVNAVVLSFYIYIYWYMVCELNNIKQGDKIFQSPDMFLFSLKPMNIKLQIVNAVYFL